VVGVCAPGRLRGSALVPSSKPHCQRAILIAALAEGESSIRNVHLCSETALVADACRAFGACVEREGRDLKVGGVAGRPQAPRRVLRVAGSGFGLRTLLALSSLADGPTVLTGDSRLRGRPLLPLVERLRQQGACVEPIDEVAQLPLVSWGGGLRGGEVKVPVETTSQFVTSLLLVAPHAAEPLTLVLEAEPVGRHYVEMTVELMRDFGAELEASADLRRIAVQPGLYRGHAVGMARDATSTFCFIAAAVAAEADLRLEGVHPCGDPLLHRALEIGGLLGVRLRQVGPTLLVSSGEPPAERVDLDVTDVPTLVPALAAVACRLPRGLRVTGAQHLRFHKTSRLETLMGELEKLGHRLTPVWKDGVLDGFESHGVRRRVASSLDCHGDHRLFMSLFLAALGCPEPVSLSGEETLAASFPDFVEQFAGLGAPVRREGAA
jgi:3-phosphoshikimate 1-carboxyvinyltransferase